MKKKLVIIGAAVVLAMVTFVLGIGLYNKYKIPYHAVIYNHVQEWFSEDFLINNLTQSGRYIDKEGNEHKYDENSPMDIVLVINNESQFEEVMPQCSLKVDFDKEVIIIYTYESISKRTVYIKSIKLIENSLIIKTQISSSNNIDTCNPYQQYLAIKMDKVEADIVHVNEFCAILKEKN